MKTSAPICNSCGALMTVLPDLVADDGPRLHHAQCDKCEQMAVWAEYPTDLHPSFREVTLCQSVPQIPKSRVA